MKLNVAVQMDPIARINIRGDSTFALLLEAQWRGHDIFYYTPDNLSLRDRQLIAEGHSLTVAWNFDDLGPLGAVEFKSMTGWRDVNSRNIGDLDGFS